jgi:hypothetical protein
MIQIIPFAIAGGIIGLRHAQKKQAYARRAAQLWMEIHAIAEEQKINRGITAQAYAIREVQIRMAELTTIAKIVKNREFTERVNALALDIERCRGVIDGLQAAMAIEAQRSAVLGNSVPAPSSVHTAPPPVNPVPESHSGNFEHLHQETVRRREQEERERRFNDWLNQADQNN